MYMWRTICVYLFTPIHSHISLEEASDLHAHVCGCFIYNRRCLTAAWEKHWVAELQGQLESRSGKLCDLTDAISAFYHPKSEWG